MLLTHPRNNYASSTHYLRQKLTKVPLIKRKLDQIRARIALNKIRAWKVAIHGGQWGPLPWISAHTRRSCYSWIGRKIHRWGGPIVWKEGMGGYWEGEINAWGLLNTCRICELSQGEKSTGGGRPDPWMGEGEKKGKIRNTKIPERK